MKRKSILDVLLCAIAVSLVLPSTVHADMGPKPSVHVRFENMGDELCYGTLLSEAEYWGPYSALVGSVENAPYHGDWIRTEPSSFDASAWTAFAEYKDADGYHFLQIGWRVSEKKELAWTYYAPERFKILLYYPQTDTFLVSGIYERYAYDTYYTVDMNGLKAGAAAGDGLLKAYRSYDYTLEVMSLLARIAMTILVEMAIGWLFGFRNKKQLQYLIGVNVATQILLNVLLNVIHYHQGWLLFLVAYLPLELLVLILESILYCFGMNKHSERPRKNWFYVLYAFLANAVSFGVGLWIAMVLPGIF